MCIPRFKNHHYEQNRLDLANLSHSQYFRWLALPNDFLLASSLQYFIKEIFNHTIYNFSNWCLLYNIYK